MIEDKIIKDENLQLFSINEYYKSSNNESQCAFRIKGERYSCFCKFGTNTMNYLKCVTIFYDRDYAKNNICKTVKTPGNYAEYKPPGILSTFIILNTKIITNEKYIKKK